MDHSIFFVSDAPSLRKKMMEFNLVYHLVNNNLASDLKEYIFEFKRSDKLIVLYLDKFENKIISLEIIELLILPRTFKYSVAIVSDKITDLDPRIFQNLNRDQAEQYRKEYMTKFKGKFRDQKPDVSIKKSEENPEPVELIAKHIIAVSDAFDRVQKSGLSERAIVLLLQDAIPSSEGVNQRHIKAILKYAPRLKDIYTK